MAVTLISTIKNFAGLSSDLKPSSPPEGSTFHVVDTGERYVFYDGTWEEDQREIYPNKQ